MSILGLTALGCGEQKANELEAKKTELQKIKTEIAALQKRADALQIEISAQDPNGGAKTEAVEVMAIELQKFNSYITIEGKVDAANSTIATPKAPGIVTAIYVSAGQYVTQGQVMASLDANAVSQGKAPLEQQLSFAKTVYEKQQRLYAQGIGTEVQLLQARTQVEATRKQIAAIDAQVAMYRIVAPISGSVESVDLKIGQATSPGMPAFKVVNLSTLKVVADVAESYSSKINKGDKVEIEFKDINTSVPSTIKFASQVIDPLNRTFRIEMGLGRVPDAKPNMLTTIKVSDYESSNAVVVPINAVQTTEEGSSIMVAERKGKAFVARKVTVKVGKNSGDRLEILEGLKQGDQIIIVGNQDLNDGQSINIKDKASAAK